MKKLVCLLFTDPGFLIKQIVDSGVKYAVDDPVAFITELAIHIVLAVFTFGKFGVVSASTQSSHITIQALNISKTIPLISLPIVVPVSSLATSITTATLSSSNAFFSLTKTSDEKSTTQNTKEINFDNKVLRVK